MKEIDRLTSQVEALAIECACLSHDRMQEVERHLIERAVSEEREACCRVICSDCRAGMSVKLVPHVGWAHDVRNDPAASVWHCDAGTIRARGPILPPLPPHRLAEENERLRAALERLVALVDPDTTGPALLRLRPVAVEIAAARALLGEGPQSPSDG